MPIRRGDWGDGDADYEAGFYVLKNTASAAVLGEVGFFTNITDARFLDSSEGQQRIARAYLQGVQPFLSTGNA
jgi:N-acetylmuramoyl-L-alanine amidase